MMEQMMRGIQQQRGGRPADPNSGFRGGDFGRSGGEKVINPIPDEGSSPGSSSPGAPPDEPPQPGSGKHVVYFDPITGRFQIKDV